jgi:hypothetical protein
LAATVVLVVAAVTVFSPSLDTPLADAVALALAATSAIADALLVTEADATADTVALVVGNGSAPGTSDMWIPGSDATQAPAPATIASKAARRCANDGVTSR